MKIRRKTVINIAIILFVLSFFVTPLGHHSKIWLMQVFSFSPEVTEEADREQITDYDWTLKDANWNFFNFERSEGNVVFINFWASWRLPSLPELKGIQKLYDTYGDQVDFYIITDEEREPVETFMEEYGFTFPITYLIIGNRSPVDTSDPPRSYIIDREGYVVVDQEGIADWNSARVHELLDALLEE
ncbi:TlpA family protein disulfide reductase [Robiginitalea sp. IMCC44478]|uniref:TlpA family protein disulfide reductase n=1 Tax=Robiginitalea sp. IMCC44478 TaxID=3459122 RepID=UPI0040436930